MATYAKHTVLLVEDDPMIAEMAREALLGRGFDVIAVGSAEEALGLAFMEVPFAMMITDINLDGRLDGWELATLMRDMRPALPIVFASGSASRDAIAARVSGTVFVSKPYRAEDVADMAARMIEEAELARVNAPSVQPALHVRLIA